ncbi:type II toxin-antitoxin system RelE family toxin [Lactiplantibacillus fabifermentans]|uniref:Uncharacterized protein n=2 Tax=Lactiplantibacillus fabifermentans TaxID=483011 RepID=A0A0R2NGW8_9LACO|nr:type II toxin-antitoxin system RelE/ParE family toxin [Lactiplantibacillus fabifermentans]ETY75390.1 plasmid stabilization protein [Lactiplantibacillus fabifermentans T30PCM01]KRO25073.1 hypothetical protein DY78_GL001430 [Lactiplantibacillus fabifermentans DSM 21115]
MAVYTWDFSKKAEKDFEKLDIQVQKRIVKWLDSHIEGASNPRIWGKVLEGDLGTFWRYRIGNYRLVTQINDRVLEVVVVKAAKRNDVYKKHR